MALSLNYAVSDNSLACLIFDFLIWKMRIVISALQNREEQMNYCECPVLTVFVAVDFWLLFKASSYAGILGL